MYDSLQSYLNICTVCGVLLHMLGGLCSMVGQDQLHFVLANI